MNLIDKLGGYEKAKEHQNQRALDGLLHDYDWELYSELLEYRRQNEIYEVGDKVVYESECKSNKVYEIESLGGDMGDLTLVGGMKPWDFQVRHATDEEIEKGCRV